MTRTRNPLPQIVTACNLIASSNLKLVFLPNLQVLSRKDQPQYWYSTEIPYSYFSVDVFSRKFKESPLGKKIEADLLDKFQGDKDALSLDAEYSVSKWEIFKACMSRELLLLKRNSIFYVFKITQVRTTYCLFCLFFVNCLVCLLLKTDMLSLKKKLSQSCKTFWIKISLNHYLHY